MADPNVLRSREEDAASRRVGGLVKNKWHLDAMLGLGGMAAVYAATHRNGQRAALKIMHIDLARDRGVVDRFLREAYLANKIGHPACVKVLDDDVTEADEPFLIMELLEGETVRDWWRRTGRTVPVAQALHIAERVLDCLAACHAQGVVHRDLKPANLFLTRAGEVKLLDFGVAREQGGERPAHGLALGTPAYMSPEQARGQVNRIDGRSDVFSVGALLHALITGRRIHRGKTEKESLHLAANEPVPSIANIAPDMPQELVRLIDRALAWEPRDRYRDAREMQSAVIAAMSSATRLSERPPQDSIVDAEVADLTPVQEVIEAGDARVREIAAWLALLEEALRQGLGGSWTDPEVEQALHRATDALADIHRRRHAAVVLEVRPFGFATFEHVVWTPEAALEPLVHRLFECGVRWLRFTPGITTEELRTLLSAWTGEVSAGRDPGIALWEAPLPHVRVEACLVAVEGDVDAREAFFAESLRIEGEAARRCHGARAAGSAREEEASPLAPDEVIRAVYATQLDTDAWIERYAEVLAEGLVDAAKTGEVATVLGALRRTAVELYEAGRVAEAVRLRQAASERLARLVGAKDAPKLEAAVTSAMFGKEAFAALLRALPERPAVAAEVAPLLARVAKAEVPALLAAFRRPMPDPVKVALEPLLARLGGDDVARAAAANVPLAAPRTPIDLPRGDARDEAGARVVVTLAAALRLAEGKPDAAEIAAANDLVQAVRAHPGAAGGGALEIFVARRAALVAGRLVWGGAAVYEAAAAIGHVLAQLGAVAVTLDGALDAEDAAALVSAARAALRKASSGFSCASQRVRLRASHDLLRVRGLEVERLPIEPRVIRTYAAAVVAIRRHFAAVGSRRYRTPNVLVRVAQAMAELASTPAWLVSSAVDCSPDGDDAARAASAAFLAASMAGSLTDSRVQIARIALAAMAEGAAKARASDAEKFALVSAAAAVLAAQGRGSTSMLARSVICFEATWMGQGAGPVYRGTRKPTLHARLVTTARAYCDAMCERSGPLLPNPETVVAAMADRAETTPERTALRLLVATLGFVPAGTVAKLTSGEVAEVIASNRGTSHGPLARLVLDETGEEYSEPFEVELALTGDDGLRIDKVVSIDNWRKGPPAATERSAPPPMTAPSPSGSMMGPMATASRPPPATGSFARDDSHPGDAGSEQRLRSPAPGPAGPEATARGDLAATPLVHVLVYALDHGLSGTLELVEADGARHLLHLVRGAPVRVRSNGQPARLQDVVNLGAGARYAFYEDVDLASGPDDTPDADPLAAVLVAVRAWSDRARVGKTLERAASLPLTLHPESMLDLAGLTPEEHAVLDAIRARPGTLAEIIVRSGVGLDTAETLVFVALVTRQLVVPGQAKGPMRMRAKSVPPPS